MFCDLLEMKNTQLLAVFCKSGWLWDVFSPTQLPQRLPTRLPWIQFSNPRQRLKLLNTTNLGRRNSDNLNSLPLTLAILSQGKEEIKSFPMLRTVTLRDNTILSLYSIVVQIQNFLLYSSICSFMLSVYQYMHMIYNGYQTHPHPTNLNFISMQCERMA